METQEGKKEASKGAEEMTADKIIPEQFDWVHARSECSLVRVFKELEQGIREDIDIAQSLVPEHYRTKFDIVKAANARFSATRVDDPMAASAHSVDFACGKGKITVYNDKDEIMFAATLTLNNEGKCRLVVNDEEVTQWQFRQRALEKLFFGTFE
jgi:hypothetical protein